MKRRISHRILFIFSILFSVAILLTSCQKQPSAKYIFYFIGDGFGISQAMLAENYLDALDHDSATLHLNLLKMPVMGWATTYAANTFVTCSAASGTALATGVKTNKGMLGVTPDTVALTSIAKWFSRNDYKVGLISTVSMDHATPAAFYANVPYRDDYVDIARQLAESNFDFVGGGGLMAQKKDSTIWDFVKQHHYTVSNDPAVIDKHQLSDGKLFAVSSELAGLENIPYVIDKPNHKMQLSYFVKKVIDLFEPSQQKFFVMIEGGEIDWACHDHDAAAALHEILEFDKAFQLAYQFYLRHPDETLIVMTADHETGGLSIGQQSTKYACFPHYLTSQKISMVQFNQLIGRLKNEEKTMPHIYSLMNQYFGFNGNEVGLNLNKFDSVRAELLYRHYYSDTVADLSPLYKENGLKEKETFGSLAIKMMSEKAGFGWSSFDHTGVAVPVGAVGCGADNFAGMMNNIDIPKKILQSAGFNQSINN